MDLHGFLKCGSLLSNCSTWFTILHNSSENMNVDHTSSTHCFKHCIVHIMYSSYHFSHFHYISLWQDGNWCAHATKLSRFFPLKNKKSRFFPKLKTACGYIFFFFSDKRQLLANELRMPNFEKNKIKKIVTYIEFSISLFG